MKFLYPQGKEKALTFSYDDGQIHDRRLVEIFNKYGCKATFHLNSGTLTDKEGEVFVLKDELKTLYAGHEVACHGVAHRHPQILPPSLLVREVADDRLALEALTGGLVQGMSYAFGCYSAQVKDVIKTLGIKYSRTVNSTGYFGIPGDFLEWHPTCHHNNPNLMRLADAFLNPASYEELPLFYVWGHSFEFDSEDNWHVLEDFAAKLAGREEIWYATNMEIYTYITAIRSLEVSADGMKVYNPSAVTIWGKEGDVVLSIAPGETKQLGMPMVFK